MTTPPAGTAIIVGGGVIGLSTAYHLARKRFGRVILLEKDRLGAGSSHRAGGIITGLLWSETGVKARSISLALYRELSAELQRFGYHFHNVGCLNLFSPADWPERAALLPLYDRLAAPYERLNAAEIRYRWRDLTPDDDVVGLHDPLGGYSEPERYLAALAARCRELGVDIRERQLVQRILRRGGRARGVETADQAIEADVVICTVHTWTLRLLAELGWAPPMKAFVHQRYVTGPLARAAVLPAINANPLEGYLRPADGDRVLVGGETAERLEFEVPGLDFRMDGLQAPPTLKDELHARFSSLFPPLGTVAWSSEHVGLLSFSMDGEPILGPAPHVDGLLLGAAFHSGGFAYNPVAGLLLAELAADGQTRLDIAAFAPDRFDPQAAADYRNRRVAQRDAIARRH